MSIRGTCRRSGVYNSLRLSKKVICTALAALESFARDSGIYPSRRSRGKFSRGVLFSSWSADVHKGNVQKKWGVQFTATLKEGDMHSTGSFREFCQRFGYIPISQVAREVFARCLVFLLLYLPFLLVRRLQ
jgi:hypothetical protein